MDQLGQKTALVLGATGGIGSAVATRLSDAGWTVRALHRNAVDASQSRPGWDWRQGDALSASDVLAAAEGADLIVHAVNPPGYRNWGELVLPMIESSIAAARATGATILLPGTIYNFGLDTFPVLVEDSPQNPVTAKGRIRAEMERRLEEAAADGVRVLIVRAGDFFGPGAANNWFSQGMVRPGRPARSVVYPGRRGTGHQWAYIPDVAETMLRLVERRDELPTFAVFHMRGVWDGDGTAMIGAIGRAQGFATRVWTFP